LPQEGVQEQPRQKKEKNRTWKMKELRLATSTQAVVVEKHKKRQSSSAWDRTRNLPVACDTHDES
jgi:hypothetical protein